MGPGSVLVTWLLNKKPLMLSQGLGQQMSFVQKQKVKGGQTENFTTYPRAMHVGVKR
ncbi:hypothetical protein RchiOBHm_Chr5g0040721 [Rosa chinensis]|uniref:Uncharacterized protein n=1 Tax=Rosa chinensis TaxID=74649 RepID=A0A2P6QCL8_ROSCH|nr:hypothetical protein RchiOBHm_Chr5g0040721 [Rosa chinensis]